ncbi:structural maintenance of chromosome containg protein,putative [Babesia bigemina]|uniref:Structural maintenance of chromosomes protein 5 n=1 Tax=Babesia bigemina TaxID=5866 RepID=A0A061D2S1_BABBI|nr:structural maintenance of chromosome containg protein,putative [Babesia bigemina]CDR94903.1 structural maintenance of chromosome containg protein,putative [Babesia bigemina]|eukprot:XP_012767089.1 structural maintenance of chromosome containg protein,putative [Babesia bigemina]
MKQFRDGAIDSITMENWMAYTGPVRLKAMPGVNIIAAANGCGKSAIVCAIAIGLGFDPSVLARGDNIHSFIKRGFNQAKLRIGLIDSKAKGGITLVDRTMTIASSSNTPQPTQPDSDEEELAEEYGQQEEEDEDDPLKSVKRPRTPKAVEDDDYEGEATERKDRQEAKKRRAARMKAAKKKAEAEMKAAAAAEKAKRPRKKSDAAKVSIKNDWAINGKPATLEMVKQLQKRLNIQVNNLITFLAQAKVGKFAAMTPQQLFRATLNAIEPSLCNDLDEITEKSKEITVLRSKTQMLLDDLNATTVKIAQLKVISDTLSKMKDATLYANLVKQRLYRIKLANLERGLKATRTRLNSTADEYKAAKEEKTAMEQKLKGLTSETSRVFRKAKLKIVKAKAINIMNVVKPIKQSSVGMLPLSDDNAISKVYFKVMTELRTFAEKNASQNTLGQTRIVNKDVLQKRLVAVNKEIELLNLQITGENELTTEIADCRMNEETLKSTLRRLQGAAVRRYGDIQVENLLKNLNAIKRDGYRQFIRWRREQIREQEQANLGRSNPTAADKAQLVKSESDGGAQNANERGNQQSQGDNANATGGDGSNSENGADKRDKRTAKLPKLLISDMKVHGRVNCCIVEEAASRYLDCLMISKDSALTVTTVLSKFKVPSVTAPDRTPVLCKVTDKMRSFGVKHFLHELVECSDMDTKYTLASVANLGTSFVVDENVLLARLEKEINPDASESPVSGAFSKDDGTPTPRATSPVNADETTSGRRSRSASETLTQEGNGTDSVNEDGADPATAPADSQCRTASVQEGTPSASANVCGTTESPGKAEENGGENSNNASAGETPERGLAKAPVRRLITRATKYSRFRSAETPRSQDENSQSPNQPLKSRSQTMPDNTCISPSSDAKGAKTDGVTKQESVTPTDDNHQKTEVVDNMAPAHIATDNPHHDRQAKEEQFFRRFYDCMVKEIGKQVGQHVRILRYYVGTKRHIYRSFKDADDVYSDYAVEIPTAPTMLHDCNKVTETTSAQGVEAVERELKDVAERIRVLGGMLYGRKQDNKAAAGRVYALSRERHSLEKTLQGIDGNFGSGTSKDKRKEEIDKMEKAQREELKEAIAARTDAIQKWIEKTKLRRITLQEAQDLYTQYKTLNRRKMRLEDLFKISSTTYEEVKTEFKRLEGTLAEQESKHKQYVKDINELNILIKAISGEIVSANARAEQSEQAREREALKIRQQKASKLDNMTEADLERELQIAELNVKQLERDDCEETQNARDMRDSIIHEEKLSTEIAQAEANAKELNDEKDRLYDTWIRRVRALVARIDANFGKYMQQIGEGAGGQIRLEAKLDEIKDAQIKILVKFHGDRDMLPLAASYQSGGERGVSTMVYILAVQHLTSNAFFVIDEINQGLDSNYETRIMTLLLHTHISNNEPGLGENGSQTDEPVEALAVKPPPQYFVLTPQLISGIDLRNATLHFPLNGPGVINGLVL